jgi:hypothetical protein
LLKSALKLFKSINMGAIHVAWLTGYLACFFCTLANTGPQTGWPRSARVRLKLLSVAKASVKDFSHSAVRFVAQYKKALVLCACSCSLVWFRPSFWLSSSLVSARLYSPALKAATPSRRAVAPGEGSGAATGGGGGAGSGAGAGATVTGVGGGAAGGVVQAASTAAANNAAKIGE